MVNGNTSSWSYEISKEQRENREQRKSTNSMSTKFPNKKPSNPITENELGSTQYQEEASIPQMVLRNVEETMEET